MSFKSIILTMERGEFSSSLFCVLLKSLGLKFYAKWNIFYSTVGPFCFMDFLETKFNLTQAFCVTD